MNGDRALYKLIDKVLSRKLQTKYSWSGITKAGNTPKKTFKAYTTKFIFEICQQADPNYGWESFENMMKRNILPHADGRSKDDTAIFRESATKFRKTGSLPKVKRCKMEVSFADNCAKSSDHGKHKVLQKASDITIIDSTEKPTSELSITSEIAKTVVLFNAIQGNHFITIKTQFKNQLIAKSPISLQPMFKTATKNRRMCSITLLNKIRLMTTPPTNQK